MMVIQPLTPQIVGEWTLNAIDISRVTIDGVDMTDLFLSEMNDEEIDDSFDDLEESTFNFMSDNMHTITEVKVILLLMVLMAVH